uniref:glucose-6-phosphate 1-epimerase n=1 Tax=Peronospora matthiolae TaxID=2874970 RepID=A0AAV1USN0_9STRA
MICSLLLKTATLVSSTLLTSVGSTYVSQGGVVTLSHPSGSFAKMSTHGATVFSFSPAYDPYGDVLVMSNDSVYDGIKPLSGGITVVFPNRDVSKDYPVPELGFARVSKWTLENVDLTSDKNSYSSAMFRLESSENTRRMWPFDFRLVYEVRLYSTCLETELTVMNIGSKGMVFQALLNNHFYVNDVRNNGVEVSGLQGVEYFDRVTGKTQNDMRESFGIMSRVDNLYKDVKNDVTATIKGAGYTKKVVVEKSALLHTGTVPPVPLSTDCVVSNPWNKDTKSDFSNEEYIHLVAIGVGTVSGKVGVLPDDSYTLNQVIKVSRYP